MREKLKPCPFCGKTDTLRITYDFSNHKTYKQVVCDWNLDGCGASSGWRECHDDNDRTKEAVEAWNKRADTQEADNGKH